MDRFEFKKDGNEEYLTSRGRSLKYYSERNNAVLLIGESDDYFYFTLMKTDENPLNEQFSLDIDKENILYKPFEIVIENFDSLEVMEEGTPEKKSLEFKKNENSIQLIFNLTKADQLFQTIEFANLRRLGDTKFKKIEPSENNEDCHKILYLTKLRYEFKVRLHKMLDEIEKEISKQEKTIID